MNLRGVYRNGQDCWLKVSPKRSRVRMRSVFLATATKPSGHCSEAKPAHNHATLPVMLCTSGVIYCQQWLERKQMHGGDDLEPNEALTDANMNPTCIMPATT